MKHTPEEEAYRRGVFHGLHALKTYIDAHPNNSLGTEACLDEAVDQARKMRDDPKAYDWYTHELTMRIAECVVSHDKFYLESEGDPK